MDLKDSNFACFTAMSDHRVTKLSHAYDAKTQTFNISHPTGTAIDLFNLRDIHFGNSLKDINLCDPSSQFYRTKDGRLPDLSGA